MAVSSGGLIQTGSVMGQELADVFIMDGEAVQEVNTDSRRIILSKRVSSVIPVLPS